MERRTLTWHFYKVALLKWMEVMKSQPEETQAGTTGDIREKGKWAQDTASAGEGPGGMRTHTWAC